MIKAAFFDLDGTLLASNGKVSATTKEALQLLKEQGILCGIATGRSPFSARALVQEVSFDVFVSYNGQYIFSDEQLIYQKELSKEVVQRLIDYGNQAQKRVIFGGAQTFVGKNNVKKLEGAWLIYLKNKLSVNMQTRLMKLYQAKPAFKIKGERYDAQAILAEPVYQCILHAPQEETEQLERLYDDWTFTRSNQFSVDIISKGSSKLDGIDRVIAPLGIARHEVMAFGDNYNDIEMIEGVGLGVAMGNAVAELQAVADYVTTNNDDAGIYQAVLKLLEKRT